MKPRHQKNSSRKDFAKQKPIQFNARWVAFQALQAYRNRGVYVSKILDDLFREHRIPPLDRRLATELANETVRRSQTLDTILKGFVARDQAEVEPDLWTILQLGALQIVCLPHIPTHAAVHETVELCMRIDAPKAKAFINGVIRNIERSIVEIREGIQEVPSLEAMNSQTLPVCQLSTSKMTITEIEFNRNLFANPTTSTTDYLAQSTSLPVWLLERLQNQDHSPEDLFRYGLWMTTPGLIAVRVNLMQTDREQVLGVLKAAGISARPGELPEAIEIDGGISITDLPGYREGWFSVQDISAMGATELLAPKPGEQILDLCAAPGGKSTHIAERLQGKGLVVACDVSKRRLKTVKENAARLRLETIQTQVIAEDGSQIPEGPFDAVLVDVPCSNTGVLGKRPEARWRLTNDSFKELIPLQKMLLEAAVERTRSGGRIVYSTCSIDAEENQGVVELVISQRDDLRLVEEQTHQPGNRADGAYQALLHRT